MIIPVGLFLCFVYRISSTIFYQVSHKQPKPFQFSLKVHQDQDSLMLYQLMLYQMYWCTDVVPENIVFFPLPQSHHVTFCFRLNHWDEKRMFMWINTGLSPRKCWFNSHLGHICSKPITSLSIYRASNLLAEWQWNLQVSFFYLYNEMIKVSLPFGESRGYSP